MSYERPFEEWQISWFRRLSELIGSEEGRELYIQSMEKRLAQDEAQKLRKLVKTYIEAFDNRDVGHKDDFSHEAWQRYEKSLKDLRSVAT